MSTPSSTSSSFFQSDGVYFWFFARSTFPHEFRIISGTQCGDHAFMQSELGSAIFIKKRVRWPRLLAADWPVTPSVPEPEIEVQPTSGHARLTPLSHDTELNINLSANATAQSEHQLTQFTDREEEISAFSMLAAAVVLAVLQCLFICVH